MSGDKKVNLADKIGVSYYDFGVQLLEDDYRVTAIEKEMNRKASDINREIFRRWLQGSGRQPVSWATVVTVLQDIGLVRLAQDIETARCHDH
jgi:hypothetical protein